MTAVFHRHLSRAFPTAVSGKGVRIFDSEGREFWWPEADAALFDALKAGLRPGVRVVALDANINDPEFADTAARELLALIQSRPAGGHPRGAGQKSI